uniref:Uncharacterized protein n=1 Tax=Siphoviridae sp. ct4fm14 TaxID=2825331 RepID=A0A8S5UTB1_9CAUD|nr:MAG TPA: hypothetical protein [Siphoviridae sp. ct4fm14]
MSCKSALYTALQTPTAVAVDGVIPLGSLIRRYGCDVSLNGSAVNIAGGSQSASYYDVDASITVAPTAAGTVTVTLYKDGVAVPGATASATATAAGDVSDLNIPALVRQACCASGSALTLVLSGAAATVNNVALRVQRI